MSFLVEIEIYIPNPTWFYAENYAKTERTYLYSVKSYGRKFDPLSQTIVMFEAATTRRLSESRADSTRFIVSYIDM